MASHRRVFVRNTGAGPLLDIFLIASIATVVLTRAYLAATGYPQVGNGTLHIAHVLWGGLLMLVAMVLALATVDARANRWIALFGGIGFGLFIDEVGKFLTKEVDYFFKPAIAIIYVCFVTLFFTFRFIERGDRMTPETALANALDTITDAPTRPLTESESARTRLLLDKAEGLPLTPAVADLVAQLPPPKPDRTAFQAAVDRWVTRPYQRFAESRLFIWLIAGYAALNLLSVVVVIANLVLLIPASTRAEARRSLEEGAGTGIAAYAVLVGSVVFAVMMTLGLVRLRRNRLRALQWFERAYVFSILVVQVFVFAESQLAGLSGLIISMLAWIGIRMALAHERERAAGQLTAAAPPTA